MRLSPIVLLLAFLLTVTPGLSQSDLPVASSQIADIQPISRDVGFVRTNKALFRTSDGGRRWDELPVGLSGTETLAAFQFSDPNSGLVAIADHAISKLTIARTKDGGDSWVRLRSAIFSTVENELDITGVAVRMRPFGSIEVDVRVPTSSNFTGKATYLSTADGDAWIENNRIVELRAEDAPRNMTERFGWRLETNGECAGFKSGCLQLTRLFIDGTDRTPEPLVGLAEQEKTAAAASAVQRFGSSPGGNTRISLQRGFDKCTNGTVAQMQTWWDTSHFFDANIYMSGRNRGCSQSLTAAWVSQVSAMGWGLIPTIVGYQSPCTSSTTTAKLSYDVAIAEQQGRGEADIAAADAINLGLLAGSILYYDMERYDETAATPGCRVATTAFLKGWTDRLKELGYKSGTYGSPKNAQEDWVTLPAASKMDAIWMARWDNVMSVWTYVSFPTFPASEWSNHQRIKQWQAPHNETWGGVTFNIDGNISDAPVAGTPVLRNRPADFDGDGKTDLSVYRESDGYWYIINSATSTISFVSFGAVGDTLVPGDYDGDGKTDQAVYRASEGGWYVRGKAGQFSAMSWGVAGDIPVPADYNGDGKTDIAVYRPSDGVWYVANSDSRRSYTFMGWGASTDVPVPADYDGDGKADFAIYRPSAGEWWIRRSTDEAILGVPFGSPGGLPAPGDFDNDGKADIAVIHGETWLLLQTSAGFDSVPWGYETDVPAPGDYDGNGSIDIAIYRPMDGAWYIRGQGGALWGVSSDLPIPRAYLPSHGQN